MMLLALLACAPPWAGDLPPPVVWEVDAVELCHDAPVGEARLAELVAWWRDLGSGYSDPPIVPSRCDGPVATGTIRVTDATVASLVADHIGGYVEADDTTGIEEVEPGRFEQVTTRHSASVHLGPVPSDDLVLHELGHALGWAHPYDDAPGHLMSPHVGPSTDGLERYR